MDGPSRRAVLASGGVLALAACSPGGQGAKAAPDPDLRLRRRVAREVGTLVTAYAAAAAAFPDQAGPLAALAAEHEAHVRALAGPGRAASTRTPAPPATPAPPVPTTVAATRSWLAGLERAAARRRTDEAVRAGPDLARLLASVGACESAHAALLTHGWSG